MENSYISRMRERKGDSRNRKSKLGRKERANWKEHFKVVVGCQKMEDEDDAG